MLTQSCVRLVRPVGSAARQSFRYTTTKRAASTSASSTPELASWSSSILTGAAVATAAGTSMLLYHNYINKDAYAMTPAEEGLHPTKYPWEHQKFSKTFDAAGLRRGFQVYREVCSSCHSLYRIPYRSMVGVLMTNDEAKAMAEEHEYPGELDHEGEPTSRPGKLSDYLPSPYKNDEAARAANNGALPPDASLLVKARHGGADYIFSLITGYPEDPPPGAVVQSGLNFNPYFPGTGIAMARVLYDGLVEYEDGTPATTSQMAKDVTEFLSWAAEPESDRRKLMGWKLCAVSTVLFAMSVWIKRYKWAGMKTRKLVYNPQSNGPAPRFQIPKK